MRNHDEGIRISETFRNFEKINRPKTAFFPSYRAEVLHANALKPDVTFSKISESGFGNFAIFRAEKKKFRDFYQVSIILRSFLKFHLIYLLY